MAKNSIDVISTEERNLTLTKDLEFRPLRGLVVLHIFLFLTADYAEGRRMFLCIYYSLFNFKFRKTKIGQKTAWASQALWQSLSLSFSALICETCGQYKIHICVERQASWGMRFLTTLRSVRNDDLCYFHATVSLKTAISSTVMDPNIDVFSLNTKNLRPPGKYWRSIPIPAAWFLFWRLAFRT